MKTYKKLLLLHLGLFLMIGIQAQEVYKLWENQSKPFYKENNLQEYEEEAWGVICVFNVTEPTLTIYKAEGENSGKSVILIPGGGYTLESIYHEGHNLARKLSAHGITAGVLKYRLPNPESSPLPEMVALSDARRALALLREKADQYGIRKDQVGLCGFSAGSHLATVTGLKRSDSPDENPDFTALIYGVTTLSDENLRWIEESLYFRKLTPEERKDNDLVKLVSNEAPPAFLVHAYDDDVCPVKESTAYAQALFDHGVPVEMHLLPMGGHGFGMGRPEDGTDQWVDLFINWLLRNNF
jgi:acetyl esterase/lipase